MNESAKRELNSIKQELSSIIKDLSDISYGIRYNFAGIGNEKCANCIDRSINQYNKVQTILNGIT